MAWPVTWGQVRAGNTAMGGTRSPRLAALVPIQPPIPVLRSRRVKGTSCPFYCWEVPSNGWHLLVVERDLSADL